MVRGVGLPPKFTSKIITFHPLIWGFQSTLAFSSCIPDRNLHTFQDTIVLRQQPHYHQGLAISWLIAEKTKKQRAR